MHYADPHAPYHAHGTAEAYATIRYRGEQLDVVSTPEFAHWERTLVVPPGESAIEVESKTNFRLRDASCMGPPTASGRSTSKRAGLFVSGTRLRAVIKNVGTEPVQVELAMWLTDLPDTAESHRRYDLEIEHVDRAIGALFGELRRRGLFRDSMIGIHFRSRRGTWRSRSGRPRQEPVRRAGARPADDQAA